MYPDGPRVANAAWVDMCSSLAQPLPYAIDACDADPSCSALHSWDCDFYFWRVCWSTVSDLAAVAPGTEACTKSVSESTELLTATTLTTTTATAILFVEGPMADNNAVLRHCSFQFGYGTMEEAWQHCEAIPGCGVLLSLDCLAWSWVPCTASIEDIVAEGHGRQACSLVDVRLTTMTLTTSSATRTSVTTPTTTSSTTVSSTSHSSISTDTGTTDTSTTTGTTITVSSTSQSSTTTDTSATETTTTTSTSSTTDTSTTNTTTSGTSTRTRSSTTASSGTITATRTTTSGTTNSKTSTTMSSTSESSTATISTNTGITNTTTTSSRTATSASSTSESSSATATTGTRTTSTETGTTSSTTSHTTATSTATSTSSTGTSSTVTSSTRTISATSGTTTPHTTTASSSTVTSGTATTQTHTSGTTTSASTTSASTTSASTSTSVTSVEPVAEGTLELQVSEASSFTSAEGATLALSIGIARLAGVQQGKVDVRMIPKPGGRRLTEGVLVFYAILPGFGAVGALEALKQVSLDVLAEVLKEELRASGLSDFAGSLEVASLTVREGPGVTVTGAVAPASGGDASSETETEGSAGALVGGLTGCALCLCCCGAANFLLVRRLLGPRQGSHTGEGGKREERARTFDFDVDTEAGTLAAGGRGQVAPVASGCSPQSGGTSMSSRSPPAATSPTLTLGEQQDPQGKQFSPKFGDGGSEWRRCGDIPEHCSVAADDDDLDSSHERVRGQPGDDWEANYGRLWAANAQVEDQLRRLQEESSRPSSPGAASPSLQPGGPRELVPRLQLTRELSRETRPEDLKGALGHILEPLGMELDIQVDQLCPSGAAAFNMDRDGAQRGHTSSPASPAENCEERRFTSTFAVSPTEAVRLTLKVNSRGNSRVSSETELAPRADAVSPRELSWPRQSAPGMSFAPPKMNGSNPRPHAGDCLTPRTEMSSPRRNAGACLTPRTELSSPRPNAGACLTPRTALSSPRPDAGAPRPYPREDSVLSAAGGGGSLASPRTRPDNCAPRLASRVDSCVSVATSAGGSLASPRTDTRSAGGCLTSSRNKINTDLQSHSSSYPTELTVERPADQL